MNISELLKGRETCECGKSHLCPIKKVEIGKGAIGRIPSLTEAYKRVFLICDGNTYKAGGKSVESVISDKICGRIIFSGDEILIPNESAIENARCAVPDGCELIIGVGSGVINDISKYVSFILGLPYYIVATAPSMDGYASPGSALILDGMKVTLNARVPEAIIADTDVLKNAPMDMILAGYGDVIGKYSCLADWKLSSIVNGEYICDFVIGETYAQADKTRSLAKGLLKRDADAIEALIEALIAVGILMAYVGNSRPASGSEHHFSHYFEIVGIVKGEKYLPHGADVFYSSAETAKIREELLSLSATDVLPCRSDKEKYESDIRRIYGKIADEVLSLQNKLTLYSDTERRISVYKEKLDEIKAVLKSAPSFSEVCKMLSEVGFEYSDFLSFYGERKIKDAYLYAKDLKDRYTVLWMYYDLYSSDEGK